MRQEALEEPRLSRLEIVSNRVALTERGKETSGGLVTGVLDALRETGGVWFGWSGETGGQRSAEPRVTEAGGLTYATVDLTHEDRDGYYNGFCNSALYALSLPARSRGIHLPGLRCLSR